MGRLKKELSTESSRWYFGRAISGRSDPGVQALLGRIIDLAPEAGLVFKPSLRPPGIRYLHEFALKRLRGLASYNPRAIANPHVRRIDEWGDILGLARHDPALDQELAGRSVALMGTGLRYRDGLAVEEKDRGVMLGLRVDPMPECHGMSRDGIETDADIGARLVQERRYFVENYDPDLPSGRLPSPKQRTRYNYVYLGLIEGLGSRDDPRLGRIEEGLGDGACSFVVELLPPDMVEAYPFNRCINSR